MKGRGRERKRPPLSLQTFIPKMRRFGEKVRYVPAKTLKCPFFLLFFLKLQDTKRERHFIIFSLPSLPIKAPRWSV